MRATIGITAGDPAGIGLEVVLKSISPLLTSARWIVFTDSEVFQRNGGLFHSEMPWRWIETVGMRSLTILFCSCVTCAVTHPRLIGESSVHKQARGRWLIYKLPAPMPFTGEIHAIVTAPVNKEAIGGNFHGQTDFLAERQGFANMQWPFLPRRSKSCLQRFTCLCGKPSLNSPHNVTYS